nr:hypothetical protein [Lysinibacillus timonensis]
MIRESLKDWQKITEELIGILKVFDQTKREDGIQQINQLLEKRENLRLNIIPPFTSDENLLGGKLIEVEKELNKLLNFIIKGIRSDIELSQKKKTSLHAYVNPYKQVYRDGTFYDKKK